MSDDGWHTVDGVGAPPDLLELGDFELLAEVTNPIRGRMLRRLKVPRSVAELAAHFDCPVTRLYHHINRLEEHGLIRVVATRRVGAVTERRYQVTARSFRVAQELFETVDEHEMSVALGSLFDVAKHALQREVEAGGFHDIEDRDRHSALSFEELHLSAERRGELVHRLKDLVKEFVADSDEDDPDAQRVVLFAAAFPDTS